MINLALKIIASAIYAFVYKALIMSFFEEIKSMLLTWICLLMSSYTLHIY